MKKLALFVVKTFFLAVIFSLSLVTSAQAADCTVYSMPKTSINCPASLDCGKVKPGDSVSVRLENPTSDSFVFNVLMSTGNPDNPWAEKLPNQTLGPGIKTFVSAPVSSEATLGEHFIRVVVFHKNPDCRVGNEDHSFSVISAATPTPQASPVTSPGTTPTTSAPPVFNLGALGTVNFNPTKVNNIEGLIVVIINWLLGVGSVLAVIAIVYSGIMYITAGADQAKAETAKKNLIWAIIGVIILLLAYSIIGLINQLLFTNP